MIAIIDDIVLVGFVVIAVLVLSVFLSPPFQQATYAFVNSVVDIVTDTISNVAHIVETKIKSKSLPREGEPNTDEELLNQDGTVKQRRHYDQNGNAEYDIDYNHPDDGSHEFPHVHRWIDGKRQKEWLPFGEFFSIN